MPTQIKKNKEKNIKRNCKSNKSNFFASSKRISSEDW